VLRRYFPVSILKCGWRREISRRISIKIAYRFTDFVCKFSQSQNPSRKSPCIHFPHLTTSITITNWQIYYSSFREYLDCSEDVTRRTCGAETGTFIRGFLKKMSSTLEKDYCEEYYKQGVNQCPNIFSSASSLVATSNAVGALLLSLLLVMLNLR
jgi:hypothetical protein